MTKKLSKDDWFVISEALCFASHAKELFKIFLRERNGCGGDLHWESGETEHGHNLIGITTRKYLEAKE